MKDYDYGGLGFLVGMIAMLILMFVLYQGSDISDLELSSMTAKRECEASLPRNQSCEVVVTAKIKDIKEN